MGKISFVVGKKVGQKFTMASDAAIVKNSDEVLTPAGVELDEDVVKPVAQEDDEVLLPNIE